MDFAFDLAVVRQDSSGKLVRKQARKGDLSDYYIYGEDVLAVADGLLTNTKATKSIMGTT